MSRFFINRPIVAMVIAIITVLCGLVAMSGLPLAMFPQIVPPQIIVSTTYPGGDAVTIEQAVAAPMEQQLNGADNMLYMVSGNANDNTCTVTVTFDVETDPNTDQVNVVNRLTQAQPFLPPQVNQFGMTFRKSTGLPMMFIALYSPKGSYDALFLSNYATINIGDALLRIPGIGDESVFGSGDYAMRIWVKPERLAKLGLSVLDLANAIGQQNAVNPAGTFGAEPGPIGREVTYTVRAQGFLSTPEQFGDIIVRSNTDGSVVRMKDIARIEMGNLSYRRIGRLDGQPSCNIALFQAPGSDALKAADQVRAVMENLKKRFPNDLDYTVGLDTTAPVLEGINEIMTTLLEAIGLVILVVFIFLQNWRATLIPIIAVPVSLIGTFAMFPFLGFSINTLSLFGLVLAVGLVVDDAIVVVEAVEHHIEEGMAPKAATIQAMDEVSGPVISIALILASVFVPLAFTSGIQGRLNKQFAITIAISVLISAFNALTLSPALAALLLRPRKESRGPLGLFFKGFNYVFGKATNGYGSVSHFLIRKLFIAALILGGFAFASGYLGKKLPSSFIPEEDFGFCFVNVQLPPPASLDRTDKVCRKIEGILKEIKGIRHYSTIGGFSILSRVSAPYNGLFFISFDPAEERKAPGLDAKGIIAAINRRLSTEVPEASAFALGPPAIPGLGNAGGFSFWLQDRSGGSVEFLAQNVKKFVDACKKRPELMGVSTQFSAGVPQIYADVDRDKALKQGLAIGDVYQTLEAYLGGLYVNQFSRFGRIWRVFLQADGEDRLSVEDLQKFYIRNSTGEMTPLSSVVTTKPIAGPEYTNRFNLYRAAQIIGSAAPGHSSGEAMDVLEEVAKEVLPPEMGYDWADLSYQEKKAQGSAGILFGLSLVFVFLILAALYESWSLPFSVLLSVPVAVLGGFAGLLLRGYDLGVYSLIGLIVLIGLAAKNAILIVEFAKIESEKGREVVDAALRGAKLRLRPILMTSFAFILGCIPLWTATGSGAVGRRILGTVVISGMSTATALAIFLIPALYVGVEKIAGRGKKKPHEPEDLKVDLERKSH